MGSRAVPAGGLERMTDADDADVVQKKIQRQKKEARIKEAEAEAKEAAAQRARFFIFYSRQLFGARRRRTPRASCGSERQPPEGPRQSFFRCPSNWPTASAFAVGMLRKKR